MNIYLIPGLGADKRMYAPQLQIFPEAQVLEHLPPRKSESLRDYAARLAPSIDNSQPFVLVGTSLGGMISVELSRIVNPTKIVLIASVKSRSEMPYFIRSMKYLRLHKPIKGDFYKKFNSLLVKRLDSRRDSAVAELIRQMTVDASSEFIEWAIDAVIHWQPPTEITTDIVHIHGTKDALFPISKVKNVIPVVNGSHVMNLTMSSEVNKILREVVYL
ncbi:MAG: alpha/beta hydrolase [Chitinophagales bacterium]|nr:alpha/beta hydrolase [Chitinophagales bacterium]